MPSILILGSTGMLGSTVTKLFSQCGMNVVEANRSGVQVVKTSKVVKFDASLDSLEGLFGEIGHLDYCINAIGAIRQIIDESDPVSVENAVKLNSEIPSQLSKLSLRSGTKIIQIATDCVFSGFDGGYDEASPRNPQDLYGNTKLQGEIQSPHLMHIRTSILGKEIETANSLMSWLLSQANSVVVKGFTNHLWNGVTTLQFAKVVLGIIENEKFSPGIHHLIPSGFASKYQLLVNIADAFNRNDLKIRPFEAAKPKDMTLLTRFPEKNLELWRDGGYAEPPTIFEMISEYAIWMN